MTDSNRKFKDGGWVETSENILINPPASYDISSHTADIPKIDVGAVRRFYTYSRQASVGISYMESIIHEDEWGILIRPLTFLSQIGHLLVKVKNATPEPDGSFKTYYLRVPPDTVTPRGGIAWSMGYDSAEDYNPEVET